MQWLCAERRSHTGNGLRDALVRAGIVVVLDILRHLAQKLALAQNEEEIQALTTQAAQEPFATCVGSRGQDRRAEDLDASPDGDSIELGTVFIIIIPDEKARPFAKRRRFTQLLSCPTIAGMARDREVHDASGCQFDDDEDENVAEPEIMSL